MPFRKTLTILCIFFSININIFAININKIIPLNDDFYEVITELYISQGLASPSSSLPYSEAEAKKNLEKINFYNLNKTEKELYNYANSKLTHKPTFQNKYLDLNWGFDSNLEIYYHSNTSYIGRDKWNRGWNKQLPFIKLSLETWPSNIFYSYSEFTIQNYYHEGGITDYKDDFGSINLMTNIATLLNPFKINTAGLNLNIPYRAFVSLGNDYVSFQLGKDRLRWGPGISGNLMIGDNLPYQNFARFSSFSTNFKYTIISSFFPHPIEYYRDDPNSNYPIYVKTHDQWNHVNGLKLMVAQRFEFNISPQYKITLNESVMYQNINNATDFNVLNPFVFLSKNAIKNNLNSLFGIELNITPAKNINIYSEFISDGFSKMIETTNYSLGFLFGLKYIKPIQKGIIYTSLEIAKTDPSLYLQTDNSNSKYTLNYGLNHIAATKNYYGGNKISYDEDYIGYKYGNDAFVANFILGYKNIGLSNFNLSYLFILHGTYDKWTAYNKTKSSSSPTSNEDAHNYNPNNKTKNAIEQTSIIGLSAEYNLDKNLKTFAQINYIIIKNHENIYSSNLFTDLQISTGIHFSI